MTEQPEQPEQPEPAEPADPAMPPGSAPSVGSTRPEPATLPDRSRDEHDVGWGERPGRDDRDDDWYLRERPPHHD